MRWKLAAAALALFAAQGASAQSLNSDWSLGGGTGIGRHATGFSGTSGDPLYQVNRAPGQVIPGYPVTNHPPVSDAGALGAPGYAPGFTPPPGAPLEYYPVPNRR
jgi:hypothetical protein